MPEEKVGPVKRGFGLLGLRTPKVKPVLLCGCELLLLYLYLQFVFLIIRASQFNQVPAA